MRPIQTQYKGYNFRSRLEARWAVFFDALRVDWQYEPEGFEFSDGSRYLPDFLLPELNLWLEVKGQPPTYLDYTREKAPPAILKLEELRDSTCHGAMFLGPDPDTFTPWIGFDLGDSSGGSSGWEMARLYATNTGVDVDVASFPGHEYFNDEIFSIQCGAGPVNEAKTSHAVQAFRSARFEFGQSGATL